MDGSEVRGLRMWANVRRWGRCALLVGFAWLGAATALAAQGTVTGVVRGEAGEPVPGAEVVVGAGARVVRTDALGRFVVRGVASGRQTMQVGLPGYAPVRKQVEVTAGAATSMEITLTRTPLELPGLQVTASAGGGDALKVTQATSQLLGRQLEREMAGTLAQTLRTQPGVAVRSMGPAATMPVMRGLTGDRILVLQDGQRTADLAGSADDHGVTIDPLTAQRVEMVRGPATLLYGNNALGGVVNVISGDIPMHVPSRAEWLGGIQAESAYPGAAASVRVTQPLDRRWVASFRAGGRSTEEMRIPREPLLGDRLANTQMRNASGSAGLGYVGPNAFAGAALKGYDFAYGLPGPPGADPVQLRGRRWEGSGRAEAGLALGPVRSVRADVSMQNYLHDELDGRSGDVLQTFALRTRVLNLMARQGRIGPLSEGAWGVSGLTKEYDATGPAALTPPADSRGLGVFGFQELPLGIGGVEAQLGGRLDDYRIASRTAERFGPGRERAFRAFSGSVGLRAPLPAGVSVAGSLARSFRAPTVEELFSNAAHAGTGAVELGNPELRAERGLAVEGVLRVQNARWNGQLAAYRNRVDDYVFLAARGDTMVYGVTLPIVAYTQGRAVLQGVEGSVEWAASRTLVLGAMADYLHAEQANGTPLSFMPPPRVGTHARWERGALSLGADVHHELRQDRVGAAEERPTPAHTIFRLHGGLRLRVGGMEHSLTLRAENLTNELHREATSRIKDFAPGPGRNVALLYRVLH